MDSQPSHRPNQDPESGSSANSAFQPPNQPTEPLTTFAREGRFWDVFLEFVDDPRRPDSARARFCFVPTDKADHEAPTRTAVIVIEATYEEAMARSQTFDEHALGALLRSAL